MALRQYVNATVLPDGTFVHGKLKDAVKVFIGLRSDISNQLKNYGDKLPKDSVIHMKRQYAALNAALPILEYELRRRKSLESEQSEVEEC